MPLKHHIEQEIKLTALDQASLDSLVRSSLVQQYLHHSCEQGETQRFAAIYYDSPDWILRKRRWSLRTRYEGPRHVSTLKRNSTQRDGFSSCEEIEQSIDQAFNRVACIPAGKIADALNSILPADAVLIPRVEVTMQRTKRILQVGETRIELVTDSGHISGNGKTMALFEVELEKLEGDLQSPATQAFTEALMDAFSLRPSQQSKHRIGLSFYD